MPRWGTCDFREFEKLRDMLAALEKQDSGFAAFCESCAKELAARLLAGVIQRTPVGQYAPSAGKKGGTLRRGWTAKSEAEAMNGGQADATAFVNSLDIRRDGNLYEIEIINPVRYASYVEFGHRTRNHKGWVPGRFMLAVTEAEIAAKAPEILEKKLERFLRGCLDG